MSEKVIGYSLLTVGVIIIVFAVMNVFMVFTGKAVPVQLFNFESVSVALVPGSKPVDLFSARDLNQMSNLGAQLLLMGFLAGAGQKLANLGVNLIRPIVVKAKEG